jgi:tight adherence protein C
VSITLLAAILMIVAPAGYATWAVIATDRSSRRMIEQNLGLAKGLPQHSTVTVPEALRKLAAKLTPVGYAAWLDRKLAGAGRPKSLPLDRLIMVKPILCALGLGFGLLLVLGSPSGATWALLVVLGAMCYFLPDLLVVNRAVKRRGAIQLELPNMLDQMLISIEAGVGFESAMTRAAQNSTGPLAEEFVRTLQDIQVGRTRREAYLDLAARAGTQELSTFIHAIIQADQYGIGMAQVMRAQALDMRIRRRQRAEQHAMKIPVKILFPIILFVFPVIFIIILGPALLNIFATFR